MRELSTPWPKLLGCIIGIAAAGLILWDIEEWWSIFQLWRDGFGDARILTPDWSSLLVAIVLLFLSYFVYRGRNWARRTLIVLVVCLGGLAIVAYVEGAVENASRFYQDVPKITLGIRVAQARFILGEVGLRFFFLAPCAFLVCALCHRDVAAAFHRDATKRSNQSMGADSEQPRA
jgi:hypothetical protein